MLDSTVEVAGHDHNSDPERFGTTLPVVNDQHNNNHGNGLHDLQPNEPPYRKQHDDRQQQMHEDTYKNSVSISTTGLDIQAAALTLSGEEVNSGDQQETFRSSNLTDDPQYLDGHDQERLIAANQQGHIANVEVHSGDQHETFRSSNLTDDPQYLDGRDQERLIAANLQGHVADVDEGPELSHHEDEDDNVTSKPISVSESGSSDDNDYD